MKENGREGEREICPCLLFAQPTLPFVHPNSTHHHPFMHIITTPHVIIQGQMSFFPYPFIWSGCSNAYSMLSLFFFLLPTPARLRCLSA